MSLFQKPYEETNNIRVISEQHVACIFALDNSNSMLKHDAIGKLNEGLRLFKEQTLNNPALDEYTRACIDVAIVTFGSDVKIVQDFHPVEEMLTPTLIANGTTPMGAAINTALDMITDQKNRYKELGTPYFRPWLFCITDGYPTDSYIDAAKRLKEMEAAGSVIGYCVGVGDYDRNTMSKIFNRIFELDNLNFPALFDFLSNSLPALRNSNPNGTISISVEADKDLRVINMPVC